MTNIRYGLVRIFVTICPFVLLMSLFGLVLNYTHRYCASRWEPIVPHLIPKNRWEKSPGSATITNPGHQEEEETNKTKQAQIEQTYEKH